MMNKISKFDLVVIVLVLSACVVEPAGYYDGGPPQPVPAYGYYGYGPAYPWDTGVGIDIIGGYGHGGYYRGGYGGGYGRRGGGYGGGHGRR